MVMTECLLVTGTSTILFSLVNSLTSKIVPVSASKTNQQRWKWRNVTTSLVHSIVSAFWVVLSFLNAPHMMDDLVNTFTASCHSLVCFSVGYFIYDSLDMLLYHRKRSTYELLVHHMLAILCFSTAILIEQCVAYVGLFLMVELNSVFLHTRQLFIITSFPKQSLAYIINAVLNIISFLLFRIFLLGWLVLWLANHWDSISPSLSIVGPIGLSVIVSIISDPN